MIKAVPVKGEWVSTSRSKLAAMKPGLREFVTERMVEFEKNPLRFFLPHGVARHTKTKVYAGGRIKLPPSDYPDKYKNDGMAFVNDRVSPYAFLLASRKTGKSIHGAAKMSFELCECEPDWECFTEHGIDYREWDGPTIAVVASFGQANLKDLWHVYKEVLPRRELGCFAPDWGKFSGETGGARDLNFGDGRPKEFVLAYSKSRIIFLSYTQQQHIWESFKAKHLHADEQIRINLLRAWEDGSSTFGDFTQAIFTLSGFMLDERPEDTGASGPLKPIWDGRTHGGKKVGRYNLDVESTPTAILSEAKKKERYDRYVNPEIERSARDSRRALAVYYPGWEPGGALLFGPDVWDREVHMIKPLWEDDKAPADWTKWRVIDYADKRVTCCSWWAVGPEFAVCYRLLYEEEMLVHQSAKEIIERSHNRQVKAGVERDIEVGATYDRWVESQCGEQYYTSMIDPRAAKWRKDTHTVAELFGRYGIENLIEASTEWNENQIPNLKDLLRIDRTRPHPFNNGEDGKPLMGASNLYFFDIPCMRPAIDEIEGLPEDKSVEGHKVFDKSYPHDFVDTAKYFASDNPRYMGGVGLRDTEDRESNEQTPFTGY
jgi:hypothetical protein